MCLFVGVVLLFLRVPLSSSLPASVPSRVCFSVLVAVRLCSPSCCLLLPPLLALAGLAMCCRLCLPVRSPVPLPLLSLSPTPFPPLSPPPVLPVPSPCSPLSPSPCSPCPLPPALPCPCLPGVPHLLAHISTNLTHSSNHQSSCQRAGPVSSPDTFNILLSSPLFSPLLSSPRSEHPWKPHMNCNWLLVCLKML